MKRFKGLIVALLAVVLGLVIGGILMAAAGDNPFRGFYYLFAGGLRSVERIGNTLGTATPLILTGLSVAFAFRTGLFNIGAPGQMLFGGFVATIVALRIPGPQWVMVPLGVLAGMAGGAMWAWVPGILKAKFNVHEVVSSIMMNWISFWVVHYSVPMWLKGPSLETEPASIPASASLRLPWLRELFNGSFINLGIVIAIIAVVIIAFILNRTNLGFRLKAVGFNRYCAEYGGINVNRSIVLAMVISGMLAGLAGTVQYTGNAFNMQIGVMPAQGFDGIAVALLGASNPVGVLLSALFFGVLYAGKGFMGANTNVSPEIADTIVAIIIYFAATSVMFTRLLDRLGGGGKK